MSWRDAPAGAKTVLLFHNVAKPSLAARLHAVNCPMVNTARKPGSPVNPQYDPTDEDIAELNERGFPVKRCKCLEKGEKK